MRIYSSYDDPDSIQLVTSWKAAEDLLPSKPGNLLCEWHQLKGCLFTSARNAVVREWDAEEEMCIQVLQFNQEIPINTEDQITCLSVAGSGDLLLAGLSNGSVRLLDRRMSPETRYLILN